MKKISFKEKYKNFQIFKLFYLFIIIICLLYLSFSNLLFNKAQFVSKINKDNNININIPVDLIKSRNLVFSKLRRIINSNLTTIQEKLNYLMIHESPDYKSKIADKILLHKYSINKLGKDICVPIIKIYNHSNEIILEDLPDKFVLKCNHGSGMNIICNNKSTFDINKARFQLNKWKNINYGLNHNEFQYLNIEPKIYAEIFLKENIEDYKIYCFHGNPKFIRVQKKYEGMHAKINNYYDLAWKLTDIETGLSGFIRRADITFNKPKNLDLMIKYSKILSEDFVFVRVDFYNINGIIYLGEMTFSPSNNGFKLKNMKQSLELGKLIDISKIKNKFFV